MGESNIFGQETTHERSSSYDPTIQRYQFVKKELNLHLSTTNMWFDKCYFKFELSQSDFYGLTMSKDP